MAEYSREELLKGLAGAINAGDQKAIEAFRKALAPSGQPETSNVLWGAAHSAADLVQGALEGFDRAGRWLEEKMPITPGYDPEKENIAGEVVRGIEASQQGKDPGGFNMPKYTQAVDWEEVKRDPSLGNVLTYGVDTGLVSIPDMVSVMNSLPAYIIARLTPLADQRAANDGREKPTQEDYAAAALTSTGSALLERVGARGIFGPLEKKIMGRIATAGLREAGTEAVQTAIENVGTRAFTEKGVSGPELLDEMAAGAVGGGIAGSTMRTGTEAYVAGRAAPAVVRRARAAQRLRSDPEGVKSDLRIRDMYEQELAAIQEVGGNVQPFNVFRNLTDRVAGELDRSLRSLSRQGYIDADTLGELVTNRDSVLKNAARGTHSISSQDIAKLDELGLDPEVAKGLKTAFLDLNEILVASRDKKTKGFWESLATKAPGPWAGMAAGASMGGPVGAGVGSAVGYGLHSGLQAAGRGLDTVTGNRRPDVLKRAEGLGSIEGYGDTRGFLDDLRANAKARVEVGSGVLPEQAKAQRQARAGFRRQNVPGGGFDTYIYDNTGLLPEDVDKGILTLAQRGLITPDQVEAFFVNPKELMQGNQGNVIMDLLAGLQQEGAIGGSQGPSMGPGRPQEAVGSPQRAPNIGNPIAYQATVDSALAGRDAAYGAIEASGLPKADQQALIGLTDAVVMAKSKPEKAAVLANAQLSPRAAKVAQQVIAPLTGYGAANATPQPTTQGQPAGPAPQGPVGPGTPGVPPMPRAGGKMTGPVFAPETGSGTGGPSTPKYPMADEGEWYGNRQYEAQGGKMVEMTPDEYLAQVRPLEMDEASIDNIDDLANHMESGRTLDPLVIYPDGKEDGRHRAYAAKKLGIPSVPVIVYPPGATGPRKENVDKVAQAKAANELPPPENAAKTQISTTAGTYKKARTYLDKKGIKENKLDFGAGLGHGGAILDADTYEPFPGNRFDDKGSGQPTYRSSEMIPSESYKGVTNFNVLNVVPKDVRDGIVREIGRVLKPGGTAIITTRGKDVMTAKGRKGPEPNSIITSADTYQKGFTTKELADYVQNTLGDGFSVKPLPSGAFSVPAGVEVVKKGTFSGNPMQVSSRVPKNQTATESELEGAPLTLGIDQLRQDDEAMEHNANLIQNMVGIPKIEGEDPRSTIQRLKDHIKDNLRFVYENIPPHIREQSKNWYRGANLISQRLADQYGVSLPQVAGLMAALSPQKDWYKNADQGKRVLDIWFNRRDFRWEPMMDATVERLTQIQTKGKDKGKRGNAGIFAVWEDIRGKTLAEIDDPNPEIKKIKQAAWLRVYDETYNDRSYQMIDPEGNFGETFMVGPEKKRYPGTSTWGSLLEIAKGLHMIEDGSRESISKWVGNKHKVRNFYNNILDPESKLGWVTIDTHAVAASHLLPLGGNDFEVATNFGTAVKPSERFEGWDGAWKPNGDTGAQGSYAIYAEAHNELAAELGILPRELQSMTWEAVRGLFPAADKAGLKKKVKAIWLDFEAGKISKRDAQLQIMDLAGGFSNPTWYKENE